MDTTHRYALPFIVPGQAQKEMTHNEALAAIDLLLHPLAASFGADDPPAAPAIGECHIVGTVPRAAWAGQAGALAGWTAGGWRFVAPRAGLIVGLSGGDRARFDGVAWERVARAAIAAPAAGADLRATVLEILAALQRHGVAVPT